jgi:hypothetical protein
MNAYAASRLLTESHVLPALFMRQYNIAGNLGFVNTSVARTRNVVDGMRHGRK